MNDLPLRDIHLPAPIDWWPPAPGWIGLGVLLLVLLLIVLLRSRKKATPLALAIRQLESLRGSGQSPREGLKALNALLKQAAMSTYGRDSVAGLEGEGWRAFLAQKTGDEALRGALGQLLTEGGYHASSPTEARLEDAFLCAEAALKAFAADFKAR